MKLLPVLSFFAILAFVSCKKDDDNSNSAFITPSTVSASLAAGGDWAVTYYYDRDHEETANYSSYSFSFAAGNVLTATNSFGVQTGTWVTGIDDSKVKLVIGFSSAALEELSEDWEILESTPAKIRLQHVSGSDGHTNLLTFEKK